MLDSPCTCFRLRGAARKITQRYDDALRPVGLKITQFSVLANLAREGDVSVTRLARLLATDRTTLTRNLGPLVANGLVTVGAGPDARTRGVALTARGRRAYEDALPLWRSAQRAIKAALGESDLATLHALLDKIRGQVRISTRL
jgi:DNA-binding MarR family transcriptional regulator